jgi:putative transposase
MLGKDDYEEWLRRVGLPAASQAAVDQIRTSPPSRRVRSAGGSVSGRFPSRKMGVSIQFESHRVELAAIYLMEHDRSVLEYYDQPPPIKLSFQKSDDRSVGMLHTPDFFVLRMDSAGWEEWKDEDRLIRLAEKAPARYVQDGGQWRCPPGERWAEPLGLYYRIRSSSEINYVLQRNIAALEDYLAEDRPVVSPETLVMVQELVCAQPGIGLAAVLSRLKDVAVDHLYSLIGAGSVYVDLGAEPIAEPARVRLYRDAETARAYRVVKDEAAVDRVPAPRLIDLSGGTQVQWDGRPWTIANVGEHETTLIGESGQVVQLQTAVLETLISHGKLTGLLVAEPELSPEARGRFTAASPEDLREANRRYEAIKPRLSGDSPNGHVPLRTIRDWMRRWQQAAQVFGRGFIGLLPRRANRGNRGRKLPENTIALMHEFIRDGYETLKQKRKSVVYAELVRECERRHVMPPSYKTFAAEVNQRPRVEQIRRRQGPRAAYSHQPFHWELTQTTPRHGDRPFEIGHIDHTELDVELVCAETGKNLGRPWLTILIDAYCRRFLALYLTFDAPSYRSAMMVLRECVRRHGRLPRTIVVDGGGEFGSIYFETLLSRYESVKKTRPPAKARFGSVCERLFGTTNSEFVHTLSGNTQIMREVRQVTKSINPKELACWTLERLHKRLCEWAYEVYDRSPHQALGMTPRDAFTSGLARMGERANRRIPYDEDFLIATLPTTRKGTAKVDGRAGVKINSLYYWSEAFRDPESVGRQVPVRYDPFNVGVAYAFVCGRWVRCISEYYARFNGRSERELQCATAELHQRKLHLSRSRAITPLVLGDFIHSVEGEEKLLLQRLRDTASKRIRCVADGDPRDDNAVAGAASPTPGGDRARSPGSVLAHPASRDEQAPLERYEDF